MDEAQAIAVGFVDAWNRKDADGLAELFVEDADFVNVVGLWWHTREQIRQAHATGFRRIFGSSVMELRKVTVRLLGVDTAVVHCAWALTGQDAHGQRAAGQRKGVLSFTALRTPDEGWLAVSAQNTDRIDGAETHLATGGSHEAVNYGHPQAHSQSPHAQQPGRRHQPMSVFNQSEIDYLTSQPLGRIAMSQPDGTLQVSPVTFTYNAELETIDINGYRMERSRKFRNIAHNGRVAFVVDDLASTKPWRPRCVEIRGHGEALTDLPDGPIIRIHPEQVISFGIDEPDTPAHGLTINSRKVN